jgi:glycosyltransferase involved in cell wall biosynthesis
MIDYFEKVTVRDAPAVSSPSRALLEKIHYSCLGPRQLVKVITYPIEDERGPIRAKEFPIEILFTGRLERRKGFDWFCSCIPDLLSASPEAGVLIAGETTSEALPWVAKLQEALRKKKMEGRCRLLGVLSHAQVKSYMQCADIVAVPSRFDNFPNVVLEAMAAGRCIVGTRSGGIPELLGAGSCGLLFDPSGGSRALLEKLQHAMYDEKLREDLGSAARIRAWSEYSPVKIVEKTIQLYEEVIAQWSN